MISNNGSILYGSAFNDIRCLSTDTKPTYGIKNGSLCTEIDTGKCYLFDAENLEWHEYSGGGGGGGGSVDIASIPDATIHSITGV